MAIDPGMTGAIAYWFKDENDIYVRDMPKTDQEISFMLSHGSTDKTYNTICYIEHIHARENDKFHVASFGKLMKNYGVCLGACHSSDKEMKQVKSQVWMSRFVKPGMKKEDRKKRLWLIAQQCFPKLKIKKPQADALCLLLYALNKENINYEVEK
jgi:hypothetical protein